MEIELPNPLSVFVDEQVQNGRHVSPAEVVIAALRSYEKALAAEQGRLDEIRAVIREGSAAIDRGDYVLVSSVEESEAVRKRLTRRPAPTIEGKGLSPCRTRRSAHSRPAG